MTTKDKKLSKPFAASVSSFRRDPFTRARIRLAFFYTLGVLFLVTIFSISVYVIFSNHAVDNLDYRGDANENDAHIEARIVERAQNRLEVSLLVVDGFIVVLAGGASYYVAGRTLRPVEKAYSAQKKFVADAAHELRTPLTVMRTGAEAVLADDASSAEYENYIRDSLEESEFLTGLVNDLLFLAHGKDLIEAEQKKLDFGLIVRQQAEFMSPYAKKKQIRLACAIHDDGKFFVRGNHDQLKRLLNNLIKNAIDYNRVEGEVDISVIGDIKHTILSIRDTGKGLDSGEIPHIFERFYKTDEARSRNSSGAGLGLAIVREIVEAHRGEIDVISERGKGTEVRVSLPAA